ncbi:hypothetical protein ElyMa_002236900 [Elysia marginata]|uniref:Lipoprotein n=1 Tax=Elysia marginata TaxID=1093978 RepID=A0AAV4FVA3_9GAST|nr:hypothetical protein ElyMa_002236900 [Elysia marginata]
MKRYLSVLVLGLFLALGCGLKAISYSYEAVCAGVGTPGNYLVKISTYGKSLGKAKEKFRSHAVHAILFKGVSGSGATGTTCNGKKPVCNVSYEENRTWFDNFFASGDYLKYVSYNNGGYISSDDRIKTADGNYKVSTVLVISLDALRKRMEKEGFARTLSKGF